MRQVHIQVPRGHGDSVMEVTREADALNIIRFEAEGAEQPLDIVIANVSNGRIQNLLEKLEWIPDLRVTFFPQSVLGFATTGSGAPEQVRDVEFRSPIEIFLGGLQSVGSWRGFLGYACAAGIVVWVGLLTETTFLLVAAMLIAPFAGPAMNVALATATGSSELLRRSMLRYSAALAVSVAVAALLTLLLGPDSATPMMVERSQVSSVSALLPLAAGAGGAINLVQSERSSLVSGAAVGVLVAASLAPPAGIVGMAASLSRWDLALDGLYLLGLQLAVINLAGTLTFRLVSVRFGNVRFAESSRRLSLGSIALTVLALAGMLAVQYSGPIHLEHATVARDAATEVRRVLDGNTSVTAVEVDARFTRADIPGQSTLLVTVFAQVEDSMDEADDQQLRESLTTLLQQRLLARWPALTPLISITLLEPPRVSHAEEGYAELRQPLS